jgi:hypothetical protein
MKVLLAVLVLLSLSTTTVFAQSDSSTFAIRVFGGTDTEAPTAPTLISATPVATSQVDIVWSAATDNFLVHGYVVFQNGVAVATTTLTSYSDLGLTASTTYTYFVKAFDPSYNYSSSSNILSATTLDNPPPEVTPTSNNGGTVARTVLDELQVTPGISTSTFFIKTARPARFEIRWGRTAAYELGYTVHDHFVSTYETTLTDLEPSTVYEYEIVGYTPFGIATVLKRGQFTTLGLRDIFPPMNVNRFTAVADGDDVRLSWQLPVDDTTAHVRIVRSHLAFPSYPQDGAIVYQGMAGVTVDEGVLNDFSPVYYTAFVTDKAGNVSSGAVAKVYALSSRDEDVVPTPAGSGGLGKPLQEVVASTSPNLPAGTRMPDLSEIRLLQDTLAVSFAHQEPVLDSTQPFVITIPKSAVFDNLKTIIVTITDPTNSKQSSSFLLRLNKDKTAYEAVIAPLSLAGMSRVTVDIYDYTSAVVGTYEKTVAFEDLSSKRAEPIIKGLFLSDIILILALVLLPLLVILLLFLFYRRRSIK